MGIKKDTHPQAMVHRIARNWSLVGTRRDDENEPATVVSNVRMHQRQPLIQVIMQAAERPSRCYSFLKEIESMIMYFCNQQLTSTPKKRNYKDIFSATIAYPDLSVNKNM